jgi:hypothetical protein
MDPLNVLSRKENDKSFRLELWKIQTRDPSVGILVHDFDVS